MDDLRHLFTKDDRRQAQDDISGLRRYILPLLMKRQGNACNDCKQPAEAYDIHHLLYHPKSTIEHLTALCEPCHKATTNYTNVRYR